jgi:tetratricopeptide (TPR) repeat protein
MSIHGIVPGVLLLLLLMAMSSGCVNSNTADQPIITPTPGAAAMGLFDAGFNAYTNGNYETALDDYNKAIAAEPKYVRAWIEKGNVLRRLNRSEEAVSAYDSALALESDLAIVFNSRGEALMTLGRYTEARDSFDKALKIAPGYAKAQENRNLTLAKLK